MYGKPIIFYLFAASLIATSFLLLPTEVVYSVDKEALLVKIEGYVSPATVEQIASAVEEVSQPQYAVMIVTLDTFGGSADSMFKIVDIIQQSRVPVIGYVYPTGKQALSAGTYILMATDYAVMAAFTTIGSAQPVLGTTPIDDSKTINAFVEKIVSYASLHKRNTTQAARFITHNDNLAPEEALGLGVIESVADSIEELLEKAHGENVYTLHGEKVLDTSAATVKELPQSLRVIVLQILVDPLISSLFISIGLFAIILGLASPGWGAELAGGVLIILGLIGQGFSINIASVALMAIGAGLIIYELHNPGFGIGGVGGIIILAVGVSLLVARPFEPRFVSPIYVGEIMWYASSIIAVIGGFFAFLIYKALKATRMKRALEPIPKGEGRAIDDIDSVKGGYVVVQGEYWPAKSHSLVKAGTRVRVVGVEGKTLTIESLESE